MNWYLKVLRQYADFSGRARRKEYWMFTLFNVIFLFGLVFISGILAEILGSEDLSILPFGLYFLGILVPWIAVMVRRLHDQNKSGWYILIRFIPIIGPIWLLVLLCTDGDKGPNKYGPNPKNPKTELDDIGVSEDGLNSIR